MPSATAFLDEKEASQSASEFLGDTKSPSAADFLEGTGPTRAITPEDTAAVNAADKAQTVGREYSADNTGLTTALAQPIMGGLKPNENPVKIALAIGGAPFALLDAALPHLTDEERKSLAKTSPGWEKTEAGAELLGKIAPFLIPMGAAAGGARGVSTLGKIAGGAFGAGAATQLPEIARQAGTIFGDPKSTAGQKILAGGELATTLGVAGLGLGGAALPKRPPTPPTLGETLAKKLNITPAAHETFVDSAKVLRRATAEAAKTAMEEGAKSKLIELPGAEPGELPKGKSNEPENPKDQMLQRGPDGSVENQGEQGNLAKPGGTGGTPVAETTEVPTGVNAPQPEDAGTSPPVQEAEKPPVSSPEAKPAPAKEVVPLAENRIAEVSADEMRDMAKQMGRDLGDAEPQGMWAVVNGKEFLFINKDLSPTEKAEVRAHELKHRDIQHAIENNDSRFEAVKQIVQHVIDNPDADPNLHNLVMALKKGYKTEDIAKELLADGHLDLERAKQDLADLKAGKHANQQGLIVRGMMEKKSKSRQPRPAPKPAPEPAGAAKPPGLTPLGGDLYEGGDISTQGGFNTPTSIKNATVDLERSRRGLPPAIQPLRRSFGEVWDKAMAHIDNDPGWLDGDRERPGLISELRDHPRALTDEEDAALLHRQVMLQNTHGSLTRQLAQLHDDGMTALIPQYRIQLAAISDQLLDLYNINKRVGTETGRGLNARKMMANEDFSLAQMELGKRAANDGRPLTDDERVQLQRLHDEIKGWQDKYDAHVQTAKEREADLQSKLEIERLKKEAKPIDPTIKRIADLVGQKLHTEADAARARIKARAFTFSAGLDPTVLADVVVIGAEHIFNGLHDFSEWSKKMVEDFTDKVQPHLDEIWKAANKKFDSIVGQTALDKARAATEAIKKLPVPEQIDRAVSQIGEKIKKGKKDEITTQVQRLARLIVQADPAIERDALIDRVHARLIEIDPNITRSEARDMISGYGDFKQLSKDQISIRLRDLKGQMQQVAKLEAMQEGQPPLKTGLERRVPSREESLLIRQVNDAKREFQVPITDPNTQLKSSLDTLKTRMQTRILDYDQKLHEGNFTTRPKREIKLDQEAFRLKNEAEKAKQRYLSGLRADKLKNRTATQKALDTMVKWSRGFLLSGPSTLAKLTSAAFWRFVSNPIESAAGSIIKRLPYAREIASRAPIEGAGVSLKTEAKAFTTGFMRGLQDAEETLRTGKSGLDRIYGSRQDSGIGELDDEQKSVVDFFGHVHGALKAPVKRVAFEKSMLQQAEFYASKGVDITDPMVQTRMTIEAYKRANRDIFMQPNRYADRLLRFINSLEEKDKTTGKTPATAKLAASGARVLLPIVKVPTNIVGETLEYATGLVTGSTKTYQAFRAGVDTLKPEEADIIMRELKKGSIGGAVLLLGYFAPQVFGGFYQKGEKRKTEDVPYGGAKVGGRVLPRTILHAPLIENAQIGATARRVADSKLRKKDKATQGITAGALAGALGLADDVPFISEMTEVTKLFNPNERQQFLADLAKSRLVPQMISQTAEYFDKDANGKPIKRKPATILQGIESGIPGLRKNVPVAKRQ